MSIYSTTPFYHQTLERFIVAFGQLFTGITVQKKDAIGALLQSCIVPIEYAPRNKWISRLREQNDLLAPQVKMTLPRIAFEMSDIRYAPDRKIGVNGSYAVGINNGLKGKIYPPTPYDVVMTMYVATKDSNDGFQILEQILPFFQPYMTLTYEILPEYRVTKDVPVTMTAYQDDDNYDGSPDEQRIEIQTFTFSAQMDFFGPMTVTTSVIKDILVKISENPNFSNPFITLEDKVNPFTANITDTYIIDSTIKEI